jgi:hypothetical protein
VTSRGTVRAARETGAHGGHGLVVLWNLPACRSARLLYAAVQPGIKAVVPMESTGLGLLETLSAVRNAILEGIGNLPAHSQRAKQAALGLNARVESTGLNRAC